MASSRPDSVNNVSLKGAPLNKRIRAKIHELLSQDPGGNLSQADRIARTRAYLVGKRGILATRVEGSFLLVNTGGELPCTYSFKLIP
jgi:hypothetical protein